MKQLLTFVLILAGIASPVWAELSPETRKAGEEAVKNGLAWLDSQQKKDGFFGHKQFPAMTGLVVWAYAMSDQREGAVATKGVDWLKTKTHANGAIYHKPGLLGGGGKATYNTAISMVALHLSGREDVRPLVLKARRFVASSQVLEGKTYSGGFGYDQPGRKKYADLSNTYIATEAMVITSDVEEHRTDENAAEVDKAKVAEFVSSLQHRKESNDASWVSEDPKNQGGFAYAPSKKEKLSERQAKRFNAYGTMTYAGVLSLIYADVDRKDPRVRSALDWAGRHWSVAENPGRGSEGYYYFMNILAKCLNAYGENELKMADMETSIAWREEVIKKLVSLQREGKDGTVYWKNDNNRFWEGDPVLVTAYTLIALQYALDEK